jgi:Cellulase (glycosyl hydrolase family 5)
VADSEPPQHRRAEQRTARARLRAGLGILAAVAIVAAVVVLVVQQTGGRGPGQQPPAPGGPMPAITVAGDQILRGGQPWWFLGFNSFTWSDNCNDPGENMSVEDVDAWFSSMRHDGHGAVRLFFFPGWDVDRLDAAVESAKRNNVYLTLTLDNGIEGCGAEEKNADWFADQDKRAIYTEHLTMLLERYRGETAIAWFEYFNEPGYADGALRDFYDEMGQLADGIDPDRLFASGTIATYSLDGEENFRTVHESPGVDVASLHEYDANEVESHWGPLAVANADGKPVIVGEFGIYASSSGSGDPGDGQSCQANLTERAERMQEKADAYIDVERGYAGALAWAWQPGNGLDECVTGNLADDLPVQEIMRSTSAE